jgi:hypothetical protein
MPDVHRPAEQKPRHPEINFLPPLDMILSFFKKKPRKNALNREQAQEEPKKVVEKLIEKLHEKDKP